MVNLKGINLYLIGMMGVGKSTTGRLLAKELGYQFFDTDHLISQLTDRSVNQIFAESGEAIFRQLETQVLSELAAYKNLTVATGGGIVLNRMNWSYLQQGLVVWLDVPLDRLWERLKADSTRPLLQDRDPFQTLKTLLQQRQPLYRQADIHIAIQGDETPTQVAQHVVTEIPKVLRFHCHQATT